MNESILNRRSFLRMTVLAGAGTAFLPQGMHTAGILPSMLQDKVDMPVRTLGRTGIKLPILSMGVMKADNPGILRAAYNSGVVHFDTAHGYQNGKNEEMVGEFFGDKPRDSYVVSTKVHIEYPREGFENDCLEKLDISLKRQKTDHVDIFYVHAPRDVETIADERVIALVKKIKESGKARFVGFSTHANKPEQLIKAAELGVYDVILVSYNFKVNPMAETNAAIARAAEAGIGIIAMKTMTGGVEGSDGKKKINAQACLKWAWQNEHITTAIPGFTNYEMFDECLAAAQSPSLTDEESKYLASIRDCDTLYCRQCGKCLAQCPEHLPVPDMMRAYMYAYGYNYARMSKETLSELHLPDDVCRSCKDGCKVQCASGFKVAERITAVMPVMNIPDALLT